MTKRIRIRCITSSITKTEYQQRRRSYQRITSILLFFLLQSLMMMTMMTTTFLLLSLSLNIQIQALAFTPTTHEMVSSRRRICRTGIAVSPLLSSSVSSSSSTSEETSTTTDDEEEPKLCYYRDAVLTKNRWEQRIELEELQIGQELRAIVKEELINGVTGPKVWVECGIGRRRNNTWKMIYGMIRLGKEYMKESVAKKKIARLRKKNKTTGFNVYVSRIRLDNDQFEVVLSPDEVIRTETLKSSSTLKPGDIITGMIVRVENYGVIIDINGYNRPGLLHIKRIAELYKKYINKKHGIINSGLVPRTKVILQVLSNDNKRLFLDFTNDTKQEAIQQLQQEEDNNNIKRNIKKEKHDDNNNNNQSTSSSSSTTTTTASTTTPITSSSVSSGMSPEEIAQWEAYINKQDEDEDDDDDDDDYDDYDEERDIEDALGLGTY